MHEKLPHLNPVNVQVREALTAYKRRRGLDPWDDLTEQQINDFELEFCRQVILPSDSSERPHHYRNLNQAAVRGLVDEFDKLVPKEGHEWGWWCNEADRYIAARLLERSVDDAKAV